MEFQIKTTYDQKTMTTLNRAMRKSVRRRGALAFQILGWIIVILGAADALALWHFFAKVNWLLLLVVLALLLSLLFRDSLSGWLGRRNLFSDARETVATFSTDGYTITIQGAETRWSYEKVLCVCETADYYVFFLSKKHGQVYDKNGFLQGDPAAFSTFITEKTGKPVKYIK